MTSAQRTLDAVYGVMRSMEKALYISQGGVLFFAISERYLMHWWNKERDGAPLGSLSTWHGSLILLIHIGLLGRIIASDGSVIDNFRSVYEFAKGKSQRVENILHVPSYTPELLKTAEERVAAQRQVSSLSGIGKTAIILSSGDEAADKLFLDGRRIPVMVSQTLHDMAVRITKTVENQGYMTKAALLKATGDYMQRHPTYRREKDRQHAPDDVKQIWDKYKRSVLNETNMEYRKPTAEEKQRFGLANDRWIITRPGKS